MRIVSKFQNMATVLQHLITFRKDPPSLAETIFGLFKAEVIWPNGTWRSLEEVEFATLEWVDWFNHRRLLEPIGDVPPAEFEAMYYEDQKSPAMAAGLN